LTDAFARVGLNPRISLTARDSDVVKTYVRLGLGVGIVAGMALDPEEDRDLVSIDATHLFPIHTTWIGFLRDGLLRHYMYDFMQILAPHLTRRVVDRALECQTPDAVTALFSRQPLPVR
jgi:LysR family cys regulon transcriptional activator